MGAPPFEMAFPEWSTNCAKPWTPPEAAATPRTPLTVGRTDSGIGLRTDPPLPLENWATPRTWKSTFW